MREQREDDRIITGDSARERLLQVVLAVIAADEAAAATDQAAAVAMQEQQDEGRVITGESARERLLQVVLAAIAADEAAAATDQAAAAAAEPPITIEAKAEGPFRTKPNSIELLICCKVRDGAWFDTTPENLCGSKLPSQGV